MGWTGAVDAPTGEACEQPGSHDKSSLMLRVEVGGSRTDDWEEAENRRYRKLWSQGKGKNKKLRELGLMPPGAITGIANGSGEGQPMTQGSFSHWNGKCASSEYSLIDMRGGRLVGNHS